VKVLRALGTHLCRRGEGGPALRLFDRALEVHPGYAPGHADRGACLIELGRVAEAEAALRKALELHGGNAAAWSNLGVCHVRGGRLEEAERCFAEAVRIDPTLGNARENLSRTREALRRPPPGRGGK
jgi:Flp pilus assembly protein TadD